jgi:hypothetical protein
MERSITSIAFRSSLMAFRCWARSSSERANTPNTWTDPFIEKVTDGLPRNLFSASCRPPLVNTLAIHFLIRGLQGYDTPRFVRRTLELSLGKGPHFRASGFEGKVPNVALDVTEIAVNRLGPFGQVEVNSPQWPAWL